MKGGKRYGAIARTAPSRKPDGACRLGKKAKAFDRSKTLGEGKTAYLTIYPETSNGGDPTSKKRVPPKKIPAFADYAAIKTSFSVRSIMLSVKVWQGISPDSRARLSGTALSANQRKLQALAKQSPDSQETALNRLLTL